MEDGDIDREHRKAYAVLELLTDGTFHLDVAEVGVAAHQPYGGEHVGA